MYLRIILAGAILAIASCKDVDQGRNCTDAHKIYGETREAGPAIWKQKERITVNTTDKEVISRVVVTDLRPDKNGEANIVEGGAGNQTVTIELKSPTILRGFQFHVEVFAVPNRGQQGTDSFPQIIIGNDQYTIPQGENKIPNGYNQTPTKIDDDLSDETPEPIFNDVKIGSNQDQQVNQNYDKIKN